MTTEPLLRTAGDADATPLAALWAEAFTPPLAPDQWLTDPDRLAHTIVAVDETGVVGSIYGLPKRLRETGGVVADAHAIGSVAVAARARGRGLARRLVSATLESARRHGAEWALLFTGTPDVYRSSGFASFEMQRSAQGPWQPSPPAPHDRVQRTALGRGATAALPGVYEWSRSDLVLAPERSELDWAMAEIRLRGLVLYTLRRDGAVAAYAIAGAQGRTGILAELATGDAAPPDAHATLLAAVGADWCAAGVDRCDLALPERRRDVAALRAFAPAAQRATDTTGMTRPLTREPRLDGIRHFGAADYF